MGFLRIFYIILLFVCCCRCDNAVCVILCIGGELWGGGGMGMKSGNEKGGVGTALYMFKRQIPWLSLCILMCTAIQFPCKHIRIINIET